MLAACGLPVDRFVFGGFLPRRSAQRRQAVAELTGLGAAVVCYESAARLAATLADVAAVRPDWQVCVGREVTKVFEEFRRGTADELARAYASEKPLGECTVVIAPPLGARTNAEAAGSNFETAVAAIREQNPSGRLGSPEEFGKACAFLCSVHTSYVTGQNLLMDGGQYLLTT